MSDISYQTDRGLLSNAASALRDQQYDQAVLLAEELLIRLPEHPAANAIAFSSYFKTQRFEEARKIGERAARLNPNTESILNNQACLQLDAGQADEAAALWRTLIDLHGEKSKWLYNLGLALRMQAKYIASISAFNRILDLEPRHDKAAFQLVELYQQIGQLEKATITSNYLRLLRPMHGPSHREYLHQAVSSNLISKHDLLQESILWNKRFIPKRKPLNVTPIQNRTALRLGFIIGKIPHSWWQAMILPLIWELQKQDQISVYWCDTEKTASGLTQSSTFHDCTNLSGPEFAKSVTDDRIDILIDVCGMRRGSQQTSLGMQVAAKQFSWLAHEGIYAAPEVIPIEDLLGQQQFAIAPSNSLTLGISSHNQKALYGINCDNGLCNMSVQTWAQILHKLDNWVLHLDALRVEVKEELIRKFAQHQIDQSRLIFDKQKLSGKGDLVLENLSYNNVINSFEAMSRGSTIIALAGELFPAQRSAALLKQLGCEDWIVDSQAKYVELVLLNTSGNTASNGIGKKQIKQSKIEHIDDFTKHFRECLLRDSDQV